MSAYLDAFCNADLEAMVSTFAIESFVKNYNFEAELEWYKMYSPIIEQDFPSNNVFTEQLNIQQRHTYVVRDIKRQFMALFVPDSASLLTENRKVKDAREIEQLAMSLSNRAQLDSMRAMKLIGFIPPDELDEQYNSEHNRQVIERKMGIFGAQGLDSVVARVEINRNKCLFCFDAVRYNDKWYIHSIGGNISVLTIIPYTDGGVILESDR